MVKRRGPSEPCKSLKPLTGIREVPVANWRRRDFCSASQLRITCKYNCQHCRREKGSLLFVTHLPEVLYHGIAFGVTAVVGVLLPVVDVDICDTANEQLKLTLIEDVDQVGRDELVEALHKGIELLINTLLNAPFSDEPRNEVSDSVMKTSKGCCDLLNVFLLVLVGHLNIPATLLKVHNDLLTESLVID
jgi:hypothetical protein